jgi:hypothetical protein
MKKRKKHKNIHVNIYTDKETASTNETQDIPFSLGGLKDENARLPGARLNITYIFMDREVLRQVDCSTNPAGCRANRRY